MWEVTCGKTGCWLLPARTAFSKRRIVEPLSRRTVAERIFSNGELLLDLVEFSLVGLLGFMPLIVIHWSDRLPKLRLPRVLRALMQTTLAVKTAILVSVTDWVLAITL